MAAAQLAVLEWVMGNSMGVPCDGRFKQTLARMWRDVHLAEVIGLVDIARKARGLRLVNQAGPEKMVCEATATLPDLLLCESVGEETATFETKTAATAVARAWAVALPMEYPPPYSFSGCSVRLPLTLQQFLRHQESQ